jgi:hypothetical protein
VCLDLYRATDFATNEMTLSLLHSLMQPHSVYTDRVSFISNVNVMTYFKLHKVSENLFAM